MGSGKPVRDDVGTSGRLTGDVFIGRVFGGVLDGDEDAAFPVLCWGLVSILDV